MNCQPSTTPRRKNFALIRISAQVVVLALVFVQATNVAIGQNVSTQALSGPDAVPNQLRADAIEFADEIDIVPLERWNDFKTCVREHSGLDFSFDYNSLGFLATESLGEDDSASGVFRSYGTWDLIGPDTDEVGRLVFKIENRHEYSAVPPSAFASELGYVGRVNPAHSDQDWRATHLYWQQNYCDGLGVCFVGFLDITDYVDVYAMASPWTTFSNSAFGSGSGTVGGQPDGALGAMVGAFLTEHFYAVASVVDANGDPTDLLGGFDSFFNRFETFTSLEFGWAMARDRLFLDNLHISFWHIGSRPLAGTPQGWGVNGSVTKVVANHWLPFLRCGWSDGGGSRYGSSVSLGVGHQKKPGKNLMGIGLNFSKPNRGTFGGQLPTQWTSEIFHRLVLTDQLQFTPSVQLIGNPAMNTDDNFIALFGMRLRLVF